MKKAAEKFTSNVWLVAIIMFRDLKELFLETYNYITTKNQIKMEININWYDFITRLFMAIALMLVFRQYYKMKKDITLSRLFNHVMFEMNYKPDELMTDKRNKIIDEIKKQFLEKVNQAFANDMSQTDIEKMVNAYFDYTITKTPVL